MGFNLPPPPGQTSLVDMVTQGVYTITAVWYRWLIAVVGRVQLSAFVQETVLVTDQNASIPATAIPRESATAGAYRISIYQQVTTPAASSSSLITTIFWTYKGLNLSQSTAAMTGNTTATQLNQVLAINVDQNTPISYATTYAAVGPGQMRYALSVICELVT